MAFNPAMSWGQQPFACFMAGVLVPTLTYFYFTRIGGKRHISVDPQNIEWDDNDSDSGEDYGDDDNALLMDGKNSSASWSIIDAPYKMVLCVNTSLGMGKGKIAAQCGHAAVGCYKRAQRQCPKALSAWEKTGCAKIAVKCPSEEEMEEIFENAATRGIPVYLVEDAGRTQIAAGSRTVLGLGPAPVKVFDDVTSHLKLM